MSTIMAREMIKVSLCDRRRDVALADQLEASRAVLAKPIAANCISKSERGGVLAQFETAARASDAVVPGLALRIVAEISRRTALRTADGAAHQEDASRHQHAIPQPAKGVPTMSNEQRTGQGLRDADRQAGRHVGWPPPTCNLVVIEPHGEIGTIEAAYGEWNVAVYDVLTSRCVRPKVGGNTLTPLDH
jgi:hypothetical protein